MNDRKPRCRMTTLVTRDPCPNEALSDYGVCAHHLAECSAEFRRLTGQDGGES